MRHRLPDHKGRGCGTASGSPADAFRGYYAPEPCVAAPAPFQHGRRLSAIFVELVGIQMPGCRSHGARGCLPVGPTGLRHSKSVWGAVMEIRRDGNGSPYVEWEQIPGSFERAWAQTKDNPEKDWAGTRRYLNVVRCNAPGQPGGNPTDFPIFNEVPAEEILIAFVMTVNGITGCQPPE